MGSEPKTRGPGGVDEPTDELADALRRVVDGYGPHAPTDPVALRAALRATRPDLPAADVALLVSAAGEVEKAAGAARRGGAPDGDAAVRAVRDRHGDLAEADVRRALAAFGAALGLRWSGRGLGATGTVARSEPTVDLPGPALPVAPVPTGASRRPDPVAGRRTPVGGDGQPTEKLADRGPERPRSAAPVVVEPGISWDERTRPVGRTASPPAPRGRGPLATAVVLAALAAVVAVVVALLPGGDPRPAPAPDRFALDQVALRYRALGAELLGGALRCAGLPTEPGLVERVGCDFGTWALELTGYDAVAALHDVRARALAADPDSARSAQAAGTGAAFAMDQTTDGATRIYWDAESPRPVSAVATTSALTMAELVEVFDERRSTAVPRPPQPGPAFASPVLWRFAAPFVSAAGGTCEARRWEDRYTGAGEQVDCDFPNGVSASFLLAADAAQFALERENQVSPVDTVPGTQRVGSWGPDAVVIDYVLQSKAVPYLYYDRADLLAYGLVWDDVLPQDQVRAFWEQNHG